MSDPDPFLALADRLDKQFASLTATAMTIDDPVRRARLAGLAAGAIDIARQIRRIAEDVMTPEEVAWPRGYWGDPLADWPHAWDCPVTYAARELANGGTAGLVDCSCRAKDETQ